jgi:hypothetical protein
MGRKRDDRTEKPKSKFAGGKSKRRQQDPKSWKKLEMNALKKSKNFLLIISHNNTISKKIIIFKRK